MANQIRILQSGLLTTVQDKGRYGYMQFGMTPAGAMDIFSMNMANLLVGNDPLEAVLETTYLGPQIEFDCDETIAITGAASVVTRNGEPLPLWQSIDIQAGDILKMAPASEGMRSYIAFSRGLDVPVIMGSKSTHLRGKLGGVEGRKLQPGDVIPLGETKKESPRLAVSEENRPAYGKEFTLRVVLGPQDDYFTKEGVETFLSGEYTITQEADRMGYRLDGPPVKHKEGPDIISDGIAHGTVQVPGNGLPIILLSDRGTTGGYTKIATVIAQDLCTLAQMAPGSKIRFTSITADEANVLYRDFFGNLEGLLSPVEEPKASPPAEEVEDDFREYEVESEGRKYKIRMKRIK